MKELTDQDKLFINTYLTNGFNSTEAYLTIKPGTKRATAATQGCILLKKPHIAEGIKEIQEKTIKKLDITKDELIADLIKIKDMNITNGANSFAAIKAIEVINKMLGFNAPEKQEVDMKNIITWNEVKTYTKK